MIRERKTDRQREREIEQVSLYSVAIRKVERDDSYSVGLRRRQQ